MQTRLSPSATLALKILIVTGCIIYACQVNAQSIVGKWKMTAAKEIITDKATGKKQDLTAQMGDITKMMEQTLEFSSDNTYFMQNKMTGAKSGIEVSGKYSFSGNQLKLQQGKSNVSSNIQSPSPVNNTLPNNVTIVSVSATTLILHYGANTTEDGKTFTIDIVDTFTKQ